MKQALKADVMVSKLLMWEQVGNVECVGEDHIRFDFLGKDSMRYENEVAVHSTVFSLMQAFCRGGPCAAKQQQWYPTGCLRKGLAKGHGNHMPAPVWQARPCSCAMLPVTDTGINSNSQKAPAVIYQNGELTPNPSQAVVCWATQC